ncbi:MAG: extracellular solute-binding protein [Pseudomonadota bacterium]|nr:extracellular solute-binding protein [Pseudomonadota bacterium]
MHHHQTKAGARLSTGRFARGLAAGLAALFIAGGPAVAAAAEINIYSHRQQFLLQPFLDSFTAETGIKTRVVYASKGLAQRLLAEGEASPADVILTVDIARLSEYADLDLLAPVDSPVLAANVPAHLRAADNRWFALSTRARLVATSVDRVADGAIADIEDLADPQWSGRVCSRKGSHVYNRSLMASVIAANGADAAEAWASGMVANFARKPQGNDRAQAKAIFEGQCDVAIMNHYYYGKMLYGDKPEQKDWAGAIRLVFTNQDGRGNHVNISGGGMAKHSPNPEAARRFLEFLTTPVAQQLYGEVNFEYPVNPAVAPGGVLTSWGDFKRDELAIERLAELAPDAQMIIDRVGW